MKSILDFRTLCFGWCLVATTLHDSIYTCDTDASKLASHLEINKAICQSDLRQNMAKLLNRLCETELVTLLACLLGHHSQFSFLFQAGSAAMAISVINGLIAP